MSGQCSICLSDYVEPVCIPCGHVYCVGCLTDVVNRPENTSTTVKCPTCRADFHLVIPDLTYLPRKYHPFVTRPVRRVYFDESPASASKRALQKELATLKPKLTGLEAKVAALELKVANQQTTEEHLMQQCERHQSKARAYREREREARKEKEKIELQCQALVERVSSLETETEALDAERTWLQGRNAALEEQVRKMREEKLAMQRKLDEVTVMQHLSPRKPRRQDSKMDLDAQYSSSADEASPYKPRGVAHAPSPESQTPHPRTVSAPIRPHQHPARRRERPATPTPVVQPVESDGEGDGDADTLGTRDRLVRPLPKRVTRRSIAAVDPSTTSPVKAPEAKKPRLSAPGSGSHGQGHGHGRRAHLGPSPLEAQPSLGLSKMTLRSATSVAEMKNGTS